MACLLAILVLGIGGAIYAKRRRQQMKLRRHAEQGQLTDQDAKDMCRCQKKEARRELRELRAARRAERRMHRGGCWGIFRRQPIAVGAAQEPAAAERDVGLHYDANEAGSNHDADEAVFTPRTEEFVHVDDVYANIHPPAYDEVDDKGYTDEKKVAVQ